MDFIYKEEPVGYEYVLKRQIKDTLCKHTMCYIENEELKFFSNKAKRVFEASRDIGYNWTLWGYSSKSYLDYDRNRIGQLHTIMRMVYKRFTRGFRVVIDKDGTPWIDNLHSAIRDILVYGEDVKICDVDYYIIDLFNDLPIVTSNGILSDSIKEIKDAISVGYDRLSRISSDIKNINYTIGEFMSEHHINKYECGISDDMIKNYIEVALRGINQNYEK